MPRILNGLALVVDVSVCSDLDAVGHEGLERDDVLASEKAAVEGELELHLARLGLRGEGLGRGDFITVGVGQRLAGGLDHEGARHGVLGARLEVLVVHGVDEGDLLGGLGVVVAVGLVGLLGLES